MKAVGVKQLKAKLSEYIRLVKAGETVLVTERDTVVAELRPAHRQDVPPSTIEETLMRMAERGEATLRSDNDMTWRPTRKFINLGGLTSQQILDELREDRPLPEDSR